MGWAIFIGIAALVFFGWMQNQQQEAEREARLNEIVACPLCKAQHKRRDLKQESSWPGNTLICASCFARYTLCPKCERFCPKGHLLPFWNINRFKSSASSSYYSCRSSSSTSLYCPSCHATVSAEEKKVIAAYAANPSSHPLRHQYGQTFHWKTFRKSILKGRSNVCESCGHSFYTMHVHHLHYKSIGRESPSDVQLLCEICHEQKHPNRVYVGPRGGRYVWENGKKKYV